MKRTCLKISTLFCVLFVVTAGRNALAETTPPSSGATTHSVEKSALILAAGATSQSTNWTFDLLASVPCYAAHSEIYVKDVSATDPLVTYEIGVRYTIAVSATAQLRCQALIERHFQASLPLQHAINLRLVNAAPGVVLQTQAP